jgi:tetratricopeptide (TPR) repeat protein
MPLVPSTDPSADHGMVRSHRFVGANTALPSVDGDDEQLRLTQAFLEADAVTVDLFAIVRGEVEAGPLAAAPPGTEPEAASTFAVGEESMAMGAPGTILTPPAEIVGPLDLVDAAVRRGESVRVEVVVRTRGVGHFFPGGTVDAYDVWVELEAVDASGRAIFHSGFVEDGGRGPVEPGAHRYRSLMLDGQGQPINKRNAWMARSVAYVRLIPPGAADTVHYRLTVPADAEGPLTLRARVRYRKFAWWNTQWAFAGVRDPADASASVAADHDTGRWVFTGDPTRASGRPAAIPDLPITTMAEAAATLRVLPRDAPRAGDEPILDRSVRERWNDYGIGLLLQGDIKGAEAAFLRVTEMDPEYADGWVNVARARLQEGNATGAEAMLRQALALDPALAKTHFFLGTALKTLGQYDDSLSHLQQAAARYPRDRVVANQIGRVLFLQRRFREAVGAFDRVLRIDPEDLQAHYNLMLSYRGLGDVERARHHELLYRRFKADESAQAITGPYRQLHPDDNTERQAIHEHGSASADASAGATP